jgi:predicted SnoaL-like aldol condensation-catalyzing enzyme
MSAVCRRCSSAVSRSPATRPTLPDLPEWQRGRAALQQFRERVNQLAPDQSVTADYLLADRDMVAVHLTMTQTLPDGERVVAYLMESRR